MNEVGVSGKKIQSVDNGWAWLVAVGMASWNFAIGGTTKSPGVLSTEFLEFFGDTLSSTTWIAASLTLTNFFFSPLAGYIRDKSTHTGMRVITGTTAIISAACMLGAAWSNNIYQAIVFFGLIPGIGSAVLDVFVISSVGLYFKKHRVLASSIAMSGSCAGGIALPFLITLSLDAHGIRGAMMLIAGIWLHIVVFAAITRPLSRYDREYLMESETCVILEKEGNFITDDHYDNSSGSNCLSSEETSENNYNQKSEDLSANTNLATNEITTPEQLDGSKITRERTAKSYSGYQLNAFHKHHIPRANTCLNAVKDYWAFLCTPGLMQLCATFTLSVTAYFTQFFILPPLMADSGISKVFASRVISVCSISELCSGIMVGFIIDKYPQRKIFLLYTSFIVSAVAGVVLSLVTRQWMFMGYAVLTGCIGGAHVPLIVPMLLEKVPARWAGSAVAMYAFVTGLGITCGPPIISLLKTHTATYKGGLFFLSACYVAAFLILLKDRMKKMSSCTQ